MNTSLVITSPLAEIPFCCRRRRASFLLVTNPDACKTSIIFTLLSLVLYSRISLGNFLLENTLSNSSLAFFAFCGEW